MRQLTAIAAALVALAACGNAKTDAEEAAAKEGADRTDIRIVGSSTVYPFALKAAETFQAGGGPKVSIESTGTDAGLAQFCQGRSMDTPDILNSSRPLTAADLKTCEKNGVKDIIEVKFGSDGIVVAQSKSAKQVELSFADFYSALAANVATSDYDCTPKPNPNKTWADVNAAQPAQPIVVYGPPISSGTRDVFAQIAMEAGAKRKFACLDALSSTDAAAFVAATHTMRTDGAWVDSGENDEAIVALLDKNRNAFGVFGYSFLEENGALVQAVRIDKVEPTFDTIASGQYRLSRPLFFYIKKSHIARLPAIKTYAAAFLAEESAGDAGSLKAIGLVPLPADQRAAYRDAIDKETAMAGP